MVQPNVKKTYLILRAPDAKCGIYNTREAIYNKQVKQQKGNLIRRAYESK